MVVDVFLLQENVSESVPAVPGGHIKSDVLLFMVLSPLSWMMFTDHMTEARFQESPDGVLYQQWLPGTEQPEGWGRH